MGRTIPFRGSLHELPAFLDWCALPVPRGFLRVLAKERKEQKKAYYTDDKYGIDRGNVFYSSREGYELPWAEAVEGIEFTLQVEAAETGKAGSPVTVALYTQDPETGRLARERAIETTQRMLVDFLRSGDMAGLEHGSQASEPGEGGG